MQGKQDLQQRVLQVINLDALVPPDHILRQIDKAVDLSFVRDRVKNLYHTKIGRPSIPPELVLRMFLLSFLYDLSDVRLCEEVAMHAGYRWFCRLNFDDPVPDRTTLVKLRKLWGQAGVFDDLMKEVVDQCVAAGLVHGTEVGVDGTMVTANAATNSLAPITLAPVRSLEEYLKRVRREDQGESAPESDPEDPDGGGTPPSATSTDPEPAHQAGDPNFHGERFSNATHRSKTDPDARLYKKGRGQEAKLRYLVHNFVDLKSGVILNTKATHAIGTAERVAAIHLLDQTLVRQVAWIKRLVADKGYYAGWFLAELLSRGVIPYVPERSNIQLGTRPTWERVPRSEEQARSRERQVREFLASQQVRSLQGSRLQRKLQRARTRVEHRFAEAKMNHGLDRARSRGLAKMHWQALLTATVQNVLRLTKFRRRRNLGQGVNPLVALCELTLRPIVSL